MRGREKRRRIQHHTWDAAGRHTVECEICHMPYKVMSGFCEDNAWQQISQVLLTSRRHTLLRLTCNFSGVEHSSPDRRLTGFMLLTSAGRSISKNIHEVLGLEKQSSKKLTRHACQCNGQGQSHQTQAPLPHPLGHSCSARRRTLTP